MVQYIVDACLESPKLTLVFCVHGANCLLMSTTEEQPEGRMKRSKSYF